MVPKTRCKEILWLSQPNTSTRTSESLSRHRRIDRTLGPRNTSWGYNRIAGALANVGHHVSDATVTNVLKRNGIPTAPLRELKMNWPRFIDNHKELIAACNFFTTKVLTIAGPTTYYVLFFIKIATIDVYMAGATRNSNKQWMEQIARSITMEPDGFLRGMKHLIHDTDSKFTTHLRKMLDDASVQPERLPPRRLNLKAYAERWIQSIKIGNLSKLIKIIITSERGLLRVLREYLNALQRRAQSSSVPSR